MDTNTIIILISTQLLTTVTIILAVINQSNNLNKKIDDKFDSLSTRLSKIESKLDISDVRYNTHSEDIKELKTDIKNIYTNKFNIVKDTPEQVPIF